MNAPALTSERLHKLIPLRNFSESSLDLVRRDGKLELVDKKLRLGDLSRAQDHVPFLIEGLVKRLGSATSTDGEVDDLALEARFPLYCPSAGGIDSLTIKPTWVLWVPASLLDRAEATPEKKSSGISVLEASGDDELFVDFYQALNAGRLCLPGLPDMAIRLDMVIRKKDANIDDIARVIQLDPALAARLINVANSAAFGGLSAARTLNEAVTRLGLDATRNIAMTFVMQELFRSDSPILNTRMRALWKHSAKVAAASSVLAGLTPGFDRDQALLAGLIHDIGKLPMLSLAREYPELMNDPAALDRVMDNLRAETGALTLRKWGFSDAFVHVALDAENWQRNAGEKADLTDLVQMAQLHSFIGNAPIGRYPQIDTVPAFKKMALGQLSPRLSILILDRASKKIEELERLLGA